MNAGTKLAAFALGLVAMVAAGAAIGAAAGPIDIDEPTHDEDHAGPAPADDAAAPDHDSAGHDGGGHDSDGGAPAGLPAGGLVVVQDGYRFAPHATALEPDVAQPFSFRVLAPDGTSLEHYDVLHDEELHLVVVGRDLVHYAHVHPARDREGTWSVELPPLPSGSYRAFADFRPSGHDQLTLGVDLTVAGPVAPAPLGDDVRTAEVAGYEVTLDGDPATDEVTVTVRRQGEVVTTEPYLGAAGHLVAIRDGDLAYLHVHPIDEVPSGPVRFAIEVPSTGRYALFFDFAHDGVVRTARFLVTVGDASAAGGGDGHAHTEGGAH